jgi:PAS domain S-box-containing protein
VTSTTNKTSAPPRLRFSLAPEPARLLRARERIRDYLTAHCSDETTVNDIVLAIEEACTNAIRHSGSTKDIDVQLRFLGNALRISIKDEGNGFDVESFDSDKPPDPLLDHGRGLYLISRLCDELRLRRDGGLEVRMVKRDALASAGALAFDRALVVDRERAAGERLRAMLDEIDEGFDAFDWEYRYVHVNAVSLRRLGKSLDGLLGRTPWEVFPALEGSELLRRYREAMELGRPSVLEHRSVVDGQWLEVRIYPTSSGISGYYRGIDERKRKEDERQALLAERERSAVELELAKSVQRERQRLYDVLETLPAMVCLLTPDYHIAFANRAFRETFGESRGRHCYEHCFDEDAPCAFCESFRPLETGEPHHWQVTTPDGTVIAAHDYPFSDLDGSPMVLEMDIDITEATHNEAALRELTATLEERVAEATAALRAASERYAFLLQHAPAAIYEIDFRGPRFTSVNDYLCTYSGYSREELLALDPSELIAEEDRPKFAERAQAVAAGQSMPPSVEYRCLTKQGEERWAVLNMAPTYVDGVPVGALVVGHDLTERKLAERALERSRRHAELLAWTASSLLSTDDPWGLVEELCRRVMAELDCQVFFNYVLDRERGRLRLNAWAGIAEGEARRIEWLDCGEALCGCAARDACPIVAEEIPTSGDPRTELVASYGITAFACHPLMVQDEVLGTLSFGTATRTSFDEDDLALMKAVADHVAMAVHHLAAERMSRRYRLLAANSRDIILFMDRDGRIIEANEAAERAYGSSRDELLALTIADLRADETRGEVAPQMAEADERGILFESTHRRKDGTVFPVEVSSRGATIDGRRSLVSVVRDISERRRAEEEHQRLSEDRRQIAERLAVIKQIGEAAASSLRVDEVATRLIEEVHRLLGTSTAIVALGTDDRLLPVASDGYPSGFVEAELTPLPHDSLGAQAFREAIPKLIEDATMQTSGLSVWSSKLSLRLGFGSFAALPMLVEGRPIGVAVFIWGEPRRFNAVEVSFLESVVAAASVGLRNALLYEAEHEAARLGEALTGIDQLLHSSLDSDEILRRALQEGGEALGADGAAVMAREPGQFVLRYIWNWSNSWLGTTWPEEQLAHCTLALESGCVVAIDDTANDPRVVGELESASIVVAPLIVRNEAVAILNFSYAALHRFTKAELDFISRLGSSLSLALENAQINAERSQSARLAEALGAIGVAISAATETESIVQIVAGAGREAIGCEGAVAVLAEGDEFQIRVASGVAEPLLGLRFERRESPTGAVSLPQEPFVSNDAARDPRLVGGFAARFGLKTLLFVPLIARAEMLGVLAFGNLSSDRPFGADETRFAGALATSAALAIENTRAYEAEHRTAETLRELLALPVPEIDGLRIGVAHRAAAAAERVGGDFYDVFTLDEQTVAFFIADVSGKGPRAAGFTETIRSAVRTLAYLDPSPSFILTRVNESLMRQEIDGLFATAALFVIDTDTGVVHYSSAGHPPAVVCAQTCRMLPTEAGVPLGTFEAAYPQGSCHLEPGDVLLAYTDGISEARRGGAFLGEDRVLSVLAGLSRDDPQRLVDGLMDAAADFGGGELADDAAVVAVSLRPEALGDS